MALGDTYNNNNRDFKHPQVNSYYRWYNGESKVDKTALVVSFWKGLIKIGIAPRKDAGDKIPSYDYQNDVAIFLTHTKARIFHDEIVAFMNKSITNGGVDTNKGLISICSGEEFGHPESTCIAIRLLNESGQVESSACYEIKTGYHKAIENFDEKNLKFDNKFYDNIELIEFVTLLEQYYIAMTNATAYSTIDSNKFINTRHENSLYAIKEALGIKGNASGGKPSYGNNSFFNRNNPENTSSAKAPENISSYDDLSSELE